MAHFPSPNKNDTNIKSLWSLNIATKYDVREKVIKEPFRRRVLIINRLKPLIRNEDINNYNNELDIKPTEVNTPNHTLKP